MKRDAQPSETAHLEILKGVWIQTGHWKKDSTKYHVMEICGFDGNSLTQYPSMGCAFRMSPPSDKLSKTPTSNFKQLSLISPHSDNVIISRCVANILDIPVQLWLSSI